MAEFWRTKQFRVILKTWNQKLEKSGFSDAEIELKGDRSLKQKATNAYRQAPNLERESRLEYYCFVGHLAQNAVFPNELEKIIMLKHSEGATIKEIVNELKKAGASRDRRTIRFIIRRYQAKWGIRHWTPKQMDLKKTTK